MGNGRLRLTVIAALASLLIGGASAGTTAASDRGGDEQADTAVPGVAPSGSDAAAVYLDAAGRVIDMDAVDESGTTRHAAVLGCTPVSGRDNPHRSSTGVAASGHGWWEKGNCSSDRAKVFNCLYEWYTDNTWRQQACSETKTLKPGGGSVQRTAARRDCRDTQRTSWRNHVDVDVIDEIDTGEKPMNQAEVDCRVY
ncbi:hypothetical protein [Streptomyces katrae]|uniref:hypothetical protein n=1 Tax=Streptomyces katrae TaxID=68223 RepID=UPI001FE21F92|nr:hypothetical protein [Streptomyces katrae]